MTIIIEGPDGAGKTTLLAQLLNDDVLGPRLDLHPKFVDSEMNGRDTMLRKVWAARHNPFPADVYDRHPLVSEYVISPVLGRPLAPGFAHPSCRSLRTELLRTSLLILCLPPLEKVVEVVTRVEGNQPQEIQWHIHGLYSGYQALIATHPFPENLYIYDYMNPHSVDNLKDVVHGYLKEHNV